MLKMLSKSWKTLLGISMSLAVALVAVVSLSGGGAQASQSTSGATASVVASSAQHASSCNRQELKNKADAISRKLHEAPPTNKELHGIYGICAGTGMSGSPVSVQVKSVQKAALTSYTMSFTRTSKVLVAANCTAQTDQAVLAKDPGASAAMLKAAQARVCEYRIAMIVSLETIAPKAGVHADTAFPGTNEVWQETGTGEACSIYSCVVWYQKCENLFFFNHEWVWHGLAGYTWSYVDCNLNGGVGYTVTLKQCFWGGRNPGFSDNPTTATAAFEVSFLFHGIPLAHSYELTDSDHESGDMTVSVS